jgi:hypothetical protein
VQKLTLASLTCGGRLVGIVRWRAKATVKMLTAEDIGSSGKSSDLYSEGPQFESLSGRRSSSSLRVLFGPPFVWWHDNIKLGQDRFLHIISGPLCTIIQSGDCEIEKKKDDKKKICK